MFFKEPETTISEVSREASVPRTLELNSKHRLKKPGLTRFPDGIAKMNAEMTKDPRNSESKYIDRSEEKICVSG